MPNRGWTGVSGGWLDTGLSSYNLKNIRPDSVSLGIKSLTPVASAPFALGKPQGSGSELLINPRYSTTGNQAVFRLHEPYNGNFLVIPETTGLQHYTATKTGSERAGYVNGSSVVTDTVAPSTSEVVGDFSIFRAGSTYNLNQIAVIYAGGYLTSAQVEGLNTALSAYLTGLGITT